MTYKPLSKIKEFFLPRGINPSEIKIGLFKGIKFNIDFSYQSQLYFGFFEMEIYSWMKKLSTDINTAIDIGVGYGEFTLYFLKSTNAKKIFAFDPAEETRPFLMSNLKLNDCDSDPKLTLISKFLGSSNNNHMITLDSMISEIIQPSLIKMDVDGAEVDILKGATEILKQSGSRWIIETHSKQLENDCIEILNKAGYKTIIISNAWWRIILPEQRPIKHNRWLAAYKC